MKQGSQIASVFREAAQAIEERDEILAELERLREVEGVAMELCSDYMIYQGNPGKALGKDIAQRERIEGIRHKIKKLHFTITEGRQRANGYLG